MSLLRKIANAMKGYEDPIPLTWYMPGHAPPPPPNWHHRPRVFAG